MGSGHAGCWEFVDQTPRRIDVQVPLNSMRTEKLREFLNYSWKQGSSFANYYQRLMELVTNLRDIGTDIGMITVRDVLLTAIRKRGGYDFQVYRLDDMISINPDLSPEQVFSFVNRVIVRKKADKESDRSQQRDKAVVPANSSQSQNQKQKKDKEKQEEKTCWFFAKGKCERGSSCKYKHSNAEQSKSNTTTTFNTNQRRGNQERKQSTSGGGGGESSKTDKSRPVPKGRCIFSWMYGSCRNKDNCKYQHQSQKAHAAEIKEEEEDVSKTSDQKDKGKGKGKGKEKRKGDQAHGALVVCGYCKGRNHDDSTCQLLALNQRILNLSAKNEKGVIL